MLAENFGRQDLLVGQVSRFDLVVVPKLGLDGEGGQEDGLLGRAVQALGQNILLHLRGEKSINNNQ